MKREGISAETISRITGLPLQVVEQLYKRLRRRDTTSSGPFFLLADRLLPLFNSARMRLALSVIIDAYQKNMVRIVSHFCYIVFLSYL